MNSKAMRFCTIFLAAILATGGSAGTTLAGEIFTTSSDWTKLARVNSTTAAGFEIGLTGSQNNGLAFDDATGILYTINNTDQSLATLNPTTGVSTVIGPLNIPSCCTPAIEVGMSGLIYLGGLDGDFYQVDPISGVGTMIAPPNSSIINVMDYAFDQAGTLWATDGMGLFTLNLSDGTPTPVSTINGPYTAPIMGIMFDENGTLLGLPYGQTSELYAIDPGTGTVTLIGNTGLTMTHGGDMLNAGCLDADNDQFSTCSGDCDDGNPNVNPAAAETCDGLDNDCDGIVDEGYDGDNDGIADCIDNCPQYPNQDQIDADLDGIGDECQIIRTLIHDSGTTTMWDDNAHSAVTDATGNLYVTGQANLKWLTIKYDPTGHEVMQIPQAGEWSSDIALDAAGNMYVTGAGTSGDMLTVKYDPAGTIVWSAPYNTSAPEYSYTIAVDQAGNVYVAGSSAITNPSPYRYDWYFIKYNPDGSLAWEKRLDAGSSDEKVQGLALDSTGFLYAVGYPYIRLVKLDPATGNVVWNRMWDDTYYEYGRDIAIDSNDFIYVTGTVHSSASQIPDLALLKYNTAGDLLWQRIYNSGSTDYGISLAVDAHNDVYIGGVNRNGDNMDYLALKYNGDGNLLWATTHDSGFIDSFNGIAVTADGSAIYLTGANYETTNSLHNWLTVRLSPPDITSAQLPDGAINTPYHTVILVNSGEPPFTWNAIGNLPDGLSLDSTSGALAGLPTKAGRYLFDAELTDAKQIKDRQSLSLQIACNGLAVMTTHLPTATVGVAYSHQLEPGCGAAPYTWAWSGTTPAGLLLDSNTGIISGTPTAIAPYSFSIAVFDALGAGDSRLLTLATDPDNDGDGFSASGGDCNDADPLINPSATETCDGADNNCDGMIDEGFDTDLDGYTICNNDCNDSNPAINPGQTETCDLIDNNCNGQIDEGVILSFWADNDADTFGNPATADTGCTIPAGNVTNSADCNDGNATINPNATEIPYNGVDENCNGMADDTDFDQDGFSFPTDCNDTNPAINPGATEIPYNGIDENCNGMTDDTDFDQDGFSAPADCNDADPTINPNATEICDGIDNNCDGTIDPGCLPTGEIYTTSSDWMTLARVDIASGIGSEVGPTGSQNNGLAFDDASGILYTINNTQTPDQRLAVLDPATGQVMYEVGPLNIGTCCTPAIEVDPNPDGPIYVGGIDGGFYHVDRFTGLGYEISPPSPQPGVIPGGSIDFVMDYAFDAGGILWATDGNQLFHVNPMTGAANPVLPINGVMGGPIMGIMFDRDGRLYGISYEPDSKLYELDLGNGNAYLIGSTGLYMPHGGDIYTGAPLCSDNDHDGYSGDGGNCGPVDCDDFNPANHPGAAEICDAIDNNCNGLLDDGLTFDLDADGYTAIGSCEGSRDDCNDTNAAIHPGTTEICDGIDNNCDGQADEGLTTDLDGDGHSTVDSCQGSRDDCNDDEALIFPGNPESCDDSLDNNCNGLMDEGCQTVCSSLPATANGQFAALNDNGEIVWTQADAGGYYQVFSNMPTMPTQLTFDPVHKEMVAINNQGDVVWLQSDGTHIQVFGLIGGVSQQLSFDPEDHFRPDINDLGDVAWSQRDTNSPEKVMLLSGAALTQLSEPGVSSWGVSINNLGDAVWVQMGAEGPQVFRMTSAGAPTTQLTFDPNSHVMPSINDWQEITWVEWDAVSDQERIFSNTRGVLLDDCAEGTEITPPDLNNAGSLVFGTGTVLPFEVHLMDANDHTVTPVAPGTDVQITPGPAVDLLFPEVTGGGDLTVQQITSPALPNNFKFAPGNAYNIDFNGSFTGPVTVCFTYDDTAVSNEANLSLLHWNGLFWADITTSLDTTNNVICGDSDTFSPFVVVEPAPASHAVYFPAIKDGPHADGLWKNFISIQAKDPSVPVNVIIKLYNSDGSLKFQANDVTPVNGRLVKTPNWIMFANLAVEAFDGTVVVEAEAPILGMTNTIAPNEEGFNIYEAPTPRTSLFFPAAYDNFASGSGYQNILHLQNINPAPATVTVEYIHDFSGTVTDVATIPAYGEYEKNVRVVFGGGFNGTIRVTTDGASVGGMLRYEYLVANKIEAMTLYEATVERSEIYLPYLYDGFGGNKNFIATMNISTAPVTCNYDFYQNAGDTGSGPVFSTSQTINPGARFSTTPSYVACGAVGCTNFTGSMVATCNGNVVSTTNFITTGVEGFSIYEAADPKALMVFPQIYDNLNGYANEVHVQNPTGSTINVGLELYFSDGTLLGTTSTSIGPYGTYVMRPYTINTAPGGYQTNGSLTVRVNGGAQANGVMSYTKPTFFDVYEAVAP